MYVHTYTNTCIYGYLTIIHLLAKCVGQSTTWLPVKLWRVYCMSELLSFLIFLQLFLYWLILTGTATTYDFCQLDRPPVQTYWLFPRVVHCGHV